MLYPILKFIMRAAVRIFFKEINFSGYQNIPKNKPIIFAANHNSAFMDAVVVAVFIEPQIHFLTRSDVFNTPFKNWILRKMNLIPIYRLQEGAENLHKNQEVFAECYRLLGENKCLIIFSEGICIQEKRLQKLKKGTARIAFGAELSTSFNLDLQVVPVGINYNKPSQFRSNLHLRFAPPVKLSRYKEQFEQEENRAITAFTRELEDAMRMEIVHLNHKETDIFYDQLAELYYPYLASSTNLGIDQSKNKFDLLRAISDSVNELMEEEQNTLRIIAKKTNNYFSDLSKLKVKDKFISTPASANKLWVLMQVLIAIIGLPLHALSLVFNYLPYIVPYKIAIKTCKHIEFVASVIIGSAAFLFLFSFIIWGSLIALLAPTIALKIIAFLAAPLLGLYSLQYYSFLKNTAIRWRIVFNKSTVTVLQIRREELLKELDSVLLGKIKSRSKTTPAS
ncbi:MAG: 1-acyl-sn-glycerol-3-phosphate acyltransferase [Bacteroidetes bacterium]|nr:1-acyl-sn-glycerol-3-phosphate acyltransferase [Bacteroidota bacterium]